jgi:NADH:ubiquinone oxidoreductase subunit 5 (subunit L)/multisubunit Na+/H+ antiporter MnhA subunit
MNPPYLLLQIIGVPVLASLFIFLTRNRWGRKAGWIAGGSLVYTTVLLCLAGLKVYEGQKVVEEYLLISPGIRLGLLADGLSLPVALIMNLLCAVLAFFSIYYVEHRIEIIYGGATIPGIFTFTCSFRWVSRERPWPPISSFYIFSSRS